MLYVFAWWLTLQVIALASLPWAMRYFGRLPDRGYAFAWQLGLLAVAYLLWIGNVFGILANTTTTVVLLIVGIGLTGWIGLPEQRAIVLDFLVRRRRLVLGYEALFLGAFAFWAVVRSYMPEIAGTEKPMELAFLNASLESPTLPPSDPWFAGSAISYYYLGYVMVANVARVAATPSGIAFNLAIAMLFALTVTGAFSIGYNLFLGARTWAHTPDANERSSGRWPWLTGALSASFVTILANWEGLLELLRWRRLVPAELLAWVDVQGLVPLAADRAAGNLPPLPSDAIEYWWWWRATRVISTYVPGANAPQPTKLDYTINEFPFFSFLLGDLHPHVLALPLAFVALGYALNLLRSDRETRVADFWSRPSELLFIGFLFGSLFMVNAWDILTYLFVLIATFGIHRMLGRVRLDLALIKECGTFALLTLGTSVLLYWPFYVTFRSQAGGLGLVGTRSQVQHFVIFWGPLLFLAGSYLVFQLARGLDVRGQRAEVFANDWTRQPLVWLVIVGIGAALAVVGAPALAIVVPLLLAAGALLWRYFAAEVALAGLARDHRGRRRSGEVLDPELEPAEIRGGSGVLAAAREPAFATLLIGIALLLVFGTELVYIRDTFGDRMNTVFKLYYQAWVLLAVASAFGVASLLRRLASAFARLGATDRAGALLWCALALVVVAAGSVYSPMALLSRAGNFDRTPTLDGLAYFEQQHPAEAEAIRWLQVNASRPGEDLPVIVEAYGGSYSEFGRVSMLTGFPTVLGWEFHEVQWRGAGINPELNRRRADVDAIYTSPDPTTVLRTLEKYNASYVYVGSLERAKYGQQSAAAFEQLRAILDVVYDRDGVTIFRVPRQPATTVMR